MFGNSSHRINILESPVSTISSAGHWFFATRKTVEQYIPGILKKHTFESLIHKSILWIDSTDSIAMLLYFALAFTINPWIAAAITLGFHIWWYFKKSAFVSLSLLPVLRVVHNEFVQLLTAGLLLSLMGINGMYLALFFGVIFFFLFKIGLLRRFWDRFDKKKANDKLPLNDRVLKMLLVKYSMKENIAPQEVQRLEKHVQDAVIKFNTKKKK